MHRVLFFLPRMMFFFCCCFIWLNAVTSQKILAIPTLEDPSQLESLVRWTTCGSLCELQSYDKAQSPQVSPNTKVSLDPGVKVQQGNPECSPSCPMNPQTSACTIVHLYASSIFQNSCPLNFDRSGPTFPSGPLLHH